MHCKTCNYPLWNLRSRTCPECGSPFVPGDFDFVPGSVKFCCPHCNQHYYGTSPSGHLTPRTFTCVSCQTGIDMDEMVLLPTEGVSEEQTRRASNPWLSAEGSLARRWMRTVGWAMTRPGDLIEGTPLASPTRKAWGFLLLTHMAVAAVGLVFMMVVMGFMMAMAAGAPGGPGAAPMGAAMLMGFAITALFAVVGFIIVALIWASLAHVMLLVTGGGTKGFGRTLQAVLYASGANVLAIIPCVNYVSWIWWVVSLGVMLRRGHGVSPLRAGVAAAVGPVVLIGGVIAVYIAVLFAFLGAAGGAGAWASAQQAAMTDGTGIVTAKLIARAGRDGAWPDHAVRLVEEQLGASNFVSPLSPTAARDVTAGGVAVSDLAATPWQERTRLLDEIAAGLGADVVAHRVGDYVFTYHGMDVGPDGRLWVVIESPSPSAVWQPAEVIVGTAAGTTPRFPAAEFPAALDEQNTVRAEFGLPALWHPDMVSDEAPQR